MENTALIPGPLTETQLAEFSQAHRSGQLPLNASSTAFEASHVIKKSQGKMFGATFYNQNAAARFILIFDLSAVPANGVAAAVTLAVGATSDKGVYYGSVGRAFEQGIVVALSTTAGTLTLAGSDMWVDAQYV